MKYKQLLETATTPGNNFEIFSSGNGLITGLQWVQGLWVPRAIVEYWRTSGWL